MSELTQRAWPQVIFEAPLLRGLDAASRDAVERAGALERVAAGEAVYREEELGDAFYVVAEGVVELQALRRGSDLPSVVRVARRGDTFGEECGLPDATRVATARARELALVARVPMALFRRVANKSGAAELTAAEERRLRRVSTLDLLRTMAFTRDMNADELDLVLDAARYESPRRGETIYHAGDRAEAFYLIAHGLVQLQVEDDARVRVQAYLARGDSFGDEEALRDQPRAESAVAMGDCRVLRVPASVLRSLVDRNPGLIERMRRAGSVRRRVQLQVVSAAAARSTQHVFKDLYQMQMARSLLTIDQESCVRCGHCANTCASLYGVARLVRRGDKVLAPLAPLTEGAPGVDAGSGARSLLLPNSCQHCQSPVCMIDCPTGAIGRDGEGEVFIREELCTGCGNCAKACPWENIRMAPRGAGSKIAPSLLEGHERSSQSARFPDVATKCDLCRAYEAPACVQACPTESIFRLDPSRDFSEVAAVLGTGPAAEASTHPSTRRNEARGRASGAWPVFAALLATGVALALRQRGYLQAAAGPGYALGVLGALCMLALTAYALPKRLPKLWLRPAGKGASRDVQWRGRVRSKIAPLYRAHLVLGACAMIAVAAHGGLAHGGLPGATSLLFWLSALLGGFGAYVYRRLPAVLSRYERKGALPEDLAREREALVDRLYQEASGSSAAVKSILAIRLLPYARARSGPWSLLRSQRGLAEEQARLLDELRGAAELAPDDLPVVSELTRTVVEMRALPLRRALTALLRAFLPVHILLSTLALLLLVAHVVAVLR